MNEHESATASSLFGTQLKRHECRECERELGVARLAQCAAEDLGETSLGGRLGTHHPKYSRTITTPARAPGSQEVDFFFQEFCGLPRDCVLHECFPRVGFKPGGQHTPATITASSEPWKIRQLGLCVCAASQYLNARENCWSLGQSVKIGRNCTWGTILPSIYGYYRGQNLVASLQLVPLQIWLLPHYKQTHTHQEHSIC